MTFLAFCCIGLGGVLLYIITGGWGISFTIAAGALAYLVADKTL